MSSYDELSVTSPSSPTIQTPRPSRLTVSHFQRNTALRSSLIKRGDRSPSRKTVSFSSRKIGQKHISNVADCWQHMQSGTLLLKLRSNVRQFRRTFSLDADLSHIRWTPTNKKVHKAKIAVDSIKEVRVGRKTELLRASESALNDLQEDCTFSLIYGDDYQCLDLVADSVDEANVWVTGLLALTSNRVDKPSCTHAMLRERWLADVFDEADKEKKGFLGEKETVTTILAINKALHPSRIHHKFKEMSVPIDETTREIDRESFIELYKEVSTRPELYFLMVRYANKDYLTCQDLRLFLETEQGMDGVSTESCEGIIEQFEMCPAARDANILTIDGFTAYLLSYDASLFDPSHATVWQDMKEPFTRYFVSASHRAFVVEEQDGIACVDGLIAALKRSSRWIELEIWNPEEGEDEPQIQRGREATSKIGLRCALETIKEYAFERSRYPLFLRIFIHCSVQWQKVTAQLLRSKLGKRLYIPSEDPTDWNTSVPTPHDFQLKILIISKKLPPSHEVGEVSEEEESCTKKKRRYKKMELCNELSSLSTPFFIPRPCLDLMTTAPHSHSMNPRQHLPHLTETIALRLMHTYPSEFAQTTRDYMVVISPNCSRLDSSNLNPQELWNHGCQLVCMNYQTPGLMMDLQEGKFSENGGCGYVLKPAILNDSLFVPGDKVPTAPQILHLRIVSAQQLTRPRGSTAKGDSLDPFVVVEVFGVSSDCAEERTRTLRNESVNASFDESFQFQISVPQMALVRFLVLDDDFIDDDFIGQFTIPFECIQPGYHHVPLLNNEGDRIEGASLFVHIAVTNKRGGGKAKKRGMSVKRKQERISTGMKVIGIKNVDEMVKKIGESVSSSISLRQRLEKCLTEWQEECGLSATGSIRQGLRLMHSRISVLNQSPPSSPSHDDESNEQPPSFTIEMDDRQMPIICITGTLPDQLSRSFDKLKKLITLCGEVNEEAEELQEKMDDSLQQLTALYDNISILCSENTLRGQKAVRASENFTWNLRILKSQISLVARLQDEASTIVAQVPVKRGTKERRRRIEMKAELILILLPLAIGQLDNEIGEIVLTPHGMGKDHTQRVVVPVSHGNVPPLPCVLLNAGAHENGETFTKGNFHYMCKNGTAEVVACIAQDESVIQLGRTFVRNGIRHKCTVDGDSVTYEQESMCFENGIHYNIGDSFRNGSFKLTCRQEGVVIEGCYLQNEASVFLVPGESRIVGKYRHECEKIAEGKVRYTVKVVGCVKDDHVYNVGQVFTDQHIRYQCQLDGTLSVLGCVDDGGVFIELGSDILSNGMVHRCYRVDRTTFFHKFACDSDRLDICIANSIVPRHKRHSS